MRYKRDILKKKGASILTALALLAIVSSCGGRSSRDTTDADQGASGSNGASSGGSGGTSTTSTDSGTDNFNPAYTYSFSLTGPGGANSSTTLPAVDTDRMLKVRVKPGAAGVLSLPGNQYSGFSAPYYCISYLITVLNQSVRTKTLALNGGSIACPNAPESDTIDFSSRLTSSHGAITIKVSAALYDFKYMLCLWNPLLMTGGGAVSCDTYKAAAVYNTHVVTGDMEIQTNNAGNSN